MANTAVRAFSTIDATEMVRNRIEEHIQEKVGKIQEKKSGCQRASAQVYPFPAQL